MAKETHAPLDALKMPAGEVCRQFELSEAARALLDDKIPARAFIIKLCEHELFPDALRLAAHALPRRDAIWWGSLCLWQVQRPGPKPEVEAALEAVVKWVRDPSEEHRRAAEAAGKKLPANDAAAGMCQAVFLSGGSISKPKLPEVPPAPHLTAKRVASIVLGATRVVKDSAACQKHFLGLALEVAEGKLGHSPTPKKKK